MSRKKGEPRSAGKHRRRRALLAADPHCYWCRRELKEYEREPNQRGPLPPDLAILTHLNTKYAYPEGRPQNHDQAGAEAGATVLTCPQCRLARPAEEQRGIVWTPGCRAQDQG